MQLNERSNQDDRKNHKSLKRICPFVEDPHDDCYCFNMNSHNIRLAIHYCQQNFEECKVYKRISKDGPLGKPLSC
jgi:hypothetical protein